MKIIDITHSLNNNSTYFKSEWHIPISIKRLGRISIAGRNTSTIFMGSHSGTHIDAPLHFIENGATTNEINLSKLVGEVQLFDFRNFTKKMVGLDDIKDKVFCKKLIFCFGWSKYWGTNLFYANFPNFSDEAINYLISINVDLIGLDTPSPDYIYTGLPNTFDSSNHHKLLSSNVVILEYLCLKDVNFKSKYTLVALPIKIEGLDGAPTRAILIEE